jgi:hypothetical protein
MESGKFKHEQRVNELRILMGLDEEPYLQSEMEPELKASIIDAKSKQRSGN